MVSVEGKGSLHPMSSHVKYRIGGNGKSIVIDGTPDFAGKHFSFSGSVVYLFVGESESEGVKYPSVQLALNASGLALKQKVSNIVAILFNRL